MIEILLPIDIASKAPSRSIELLSVSLMYKVLTKEPIEPPLVSTSPFDGGLPAPQT